MKCFGKTLYGYIGGEMKFLYMLDIVYRVKWKKRHMTCEPTKITTQQLEERKQHGKSNQRIMTRRLSIHSWASTIYPHNAIPDPKRARDQILPHHPPARCIITAPNLFPNLPLQPSPPTPPREPLRDMLMNKKLHIKFCYGGDVSHCKENGIDQNKKKKQTPY